MRNILPLSYSLQGTGHRPFRDHYPEREHHYEYSQKTGALVLSDVVDPFCPKKINVAKTAYLQGSHLA